MGVEKRRTLPCARSAGVASGESDEPQLQNNRRKATAAPDSRKSTADVNNHARLRLAVGCAKLQPNESNATTDLLHLISLPQADGVLHAFYRASTCHGCACCRRVCFVQPRTNDREPIATGKRARLSLSAFRQDQRRALRAGLRRRNGAAAKRDRANLQ